MKDMMFGWEIIGEIDIVCNIEHSIPKKWNIGIFGMLAQFACIIRRVVITVHLIHVASHILLFATFDVKLLYSTKLG